MEKLQARLLIFQTCNKYGYNQSNLSPEYNNNVISCTSSLRVKQSQLKKRITSTYSLMIAKKKVKDFKNLDQFPNLKEAVVPAIKTLPSGSMNTKVIINEGEIVERVYETPKGEIISLFPNQSSKGAA